MDQLRLYLESDLSEATKNCNECPALEFQKDEHGYCLACPFQEIDARLPESLRAWADNLIRLFHWGRAGYPLGSEELDWSQWQGLSVIGQWQRIKEIEAMTPKIKVG